MWEIPSKYAHVLRATKTCLLLNTKSSIPQLMTGGDYIITILEQRLSKRHGHMRKLDENASSQAPFQIC